MLPYIDIHTHHKPNCKSDVISIRSLLVQDYNEAKNYNGYFTIGLHPWYIKDIDTDKTLQIIEQVAVLPNCLGIGEIGIDHLTDSPVDKQLALFERQLILADKLQLPVVIHNVRSLTEILQALKILKFENPFIFHGFTGKQEMAEQIIHAGGYLSFGKSLFTHQHTQEALKSTAKDKFFFETDNSDQPIEDVYNKASEIANIPIIDCKQTVYNNFTKIFTKYNAKLA